MSKMTRLSRLDFSYHEIFDVVGARTMHLRFKGSKLRFDLGQVGLSQSSGHVDTHNWSMFYK